MYSTHSQTVQKNKNFACMVCVLFVHIHTFIEKESKYKI